MTTIAFIAAVLCLKMLLSISLVLGGVGARMRNVGVLISMTTILVSRISM